MLPQKRSSRSRPVTEVERRVVKKRTINPEGFNAFVRTSFLSRLCNSRTQQAGRCTSQAQGTRKGRVAGRADYVPFFLF